MLAEFVGMPYDLQNQKGVNCWSLVALVYDKLFGDKLNDYSAGNIQSVSAAFSAAFAEGKHGFTKVEKPSDFDVVVMYRDKTTHCGVYYQGRLLHANNDAKQVIYERLKDATRAFERVEFWSRSHT